MDSLQSLTALHVQAILGLLSFVCIVLSFAKRRGPAATPLLPSSAAVASAVPSDFHSFQRHYLTVYLLCTFSDWLKGPYVYALYVEYGFSQTEIAWLFAGGFLSSLVFGTIAGLLSDRFGRKLMCLIFCAVYAASAVTKVINSFFWLFLGRVLSGIATSLLFTTFESWMVSEHHARQFPEALIANTFSKAIWGNGLVAVLAGVVAQAAATMYGFAAPFLVAIPCLGLAAFLMLGWEENYGNANISPQETFARGIEAVRKERKLQLLGVCQALFEGAMYSWVFYWTPCLTSASLDRHSASDQVLPFGLIFACFMCAMMIGGAVTDLVCIDNFLLPLHFLAFASMVVASVFFEAKTVVFVCFVLFEGLVGTYFGAHGTLRSLHIEESTRASVMNIFRVPLNIIVLGTITLEVTPKHVVPLLGLYLLLSLVACVAFTKTVSQNLRNETSR
jgi:MFS family permease